MRIAHFGPSTLPIPYERGGAVQRRMIELAAEQVRLGHEVTIFSPQDSDTRYLHRGVLIEGVGLRFRRPWRDYEFLRAAYQRLRRTQVDVVHFHGVPDGAHLARRLGLPSVLSFDYFKFRLSRSKIGSAYLRHSLRAFDLLLPVSHACARLATDYWGPLHFEVLPNGVNLDQFRPEPGDGQRVRGALGAACGQCVVLYVGRLCEQKGTDTLLDAWEARGPNQGELLVMAGPVGQFGNQGEGELVKRLRNLGGAYLGAVTEDSLAGVYNACDVFVMPTREDEMFGMAALEAQACGKPVIASDWGGLHESVSAGSGRFFRAGAAGELAQALDQVIEDGDSRREMANAARSHASQYSWQGIARKSIALYEQVIAARDGDEATMERLLTSYVSPSESLWRFTELRAVQRLHPDRPILEVGCGDGAFTRLALGHVDRAIDINRHAVERASRQPDVYDVVEVADARRLPAADGSVGTVFANCVLEHIPEIHSVLAECERVLRPGGSLVATVPLVEMNEHLVFRGRWYSNWRQRRLVHHNLWSMAEWARRLEEVGFETVETTPYLSGRLCRYWDALDAPLMVGVGRFSLGVLLRRVPRIIPSSARSVVKSRLATIPFT